MMFLKKCAAQGIFAFPCSPNQENPCTFRFDDLRKCRVVRETYFLVKIDHTFSDSDSIDARYFIDDAVGELYYSGGTGKGSDVQFQRHPDTRRQLFNTTWRRSVSPSLVNAASAREMLGFAWVIAQHVKPRPAG